MRKFYITSENDTSLKIDLMEKDAFGASPQGLGVSASTSHYQAGNDVINVDYATSFPEMSFVMVFSGMNKDPYQAYNEFMEKLNTMDLILVYNDDYRRKVQFAGISKGELAVDGALYCGLSLSPMSPWYKWETTGTVIVKRDSKQYAKIDTTGCLHLIPNQTVPINFSYKFNFAGGSRMIMELYDSSFNKIQSSIFEGISFDKGAEFTFSSDYANLLALIKDSSGEKNFMPMLSTDSTGLMRIPSNGIYYLYVGVDGFEENDYELIVRKERVTV